MLFFKSSIQAFYWAVNPQQHYILIIYQSSFRLSSGLILESMFKVEMKQK